MRPWPAALNAIGGNTLLPASPNGQGINAAAGLAWDTDPTSQQYGRAYLVCVGQGSAAPPTRIFSWVIPADSGATWSAPERVNDDCGQTSQFMPRVAVDPTDGALALCWYDCRNDIGVTYGTNYPVTNVITTNLMTNADNSITTNITHQLHHQYR